MKKISLSLAVILSTSLLASCGQNQQEKTLANLEQEQSTYSQQAKTDQLQSETLTTESQNLDKQVDEASTKSKYDKAQADLLKSEAVQDLSKAASLDSEIAKAKAAAS